MARVSLNSTLRSSVAMVALIVVAVMSWVPQRVIWIIGGTLGWLFSLLPSRVKRITAWNIELCFRDLLPHERRRLVWRHLRMFGIGILSIGAAWWAPRRRLRRLVKTRDQHHLDQLLAEGRNVILLAPHFIALDICGVRLSLDRKIVSMYRESKNGLLNRISRRRTRFGIVLVERESSLRPLVRLVRKGMPFYYLPDQDLEGRASVFVPFFGIQASTVTALSRIAKMTQAAVVPCISYILPGGRGYEVRFLPPMADFPTDDSEEDARRMNLEIESWIREMPEQYMWAVRRFKTRPVGEPSFYRQNPDA